MNQMLRHWRHSRVVLAVVSTFLKGTATFLFLLLCLRFQIASLLFAWPLLIPVLILTVGGITLGVWMPIPGLCAFTLAVPLLNGLAGDGILGSASPIALVFSALWTGILIRRMWQHYAGQRRLAPHDRARPFTTSEVIASRGIFESGGTVSSPVSGVNNDTFSNRCVRFTIGVLTTAVLVSYAWQLWMHRRSDALLPALLRSPIQAYGDPLYFITSAFIWLQGLFYFDSIYRADCLINSDRPDIQVGFGTLRTWVRPFFATYAVTMTLFLLIQFLFHVPEGWADAGFQAPYEDISSFGSIASSIFVFLLAASKRTHWKMVLARILGCAICLLMVIVSWSRASWLAAFVFLMVTAMVYLPRLYNYAILVAVVAGVGMININIDGPAWRSNIYLVRLGTLVRIENPANKNNGRFHLYGKAERMICDYPFLGAGVGSFYLNSVAYAEPNDPYWRARIPDFAHNIILQIAAEEGIPIAALFAALTMFVLWRGFRVSRERQSIRWPDRCLLGASLALACYLQTQMTANSLNVYLSNQLFFWFLLAAVIKMCDEKHRADSVDVSWNRSSVG
jgi:O-antigen ligase